MIDLVQSGTLVAVFSAAAVAMRIALKAVIVVWSFKGTKSDRQHALALLHALSMKKDQQTEQSPPCGPGKPSGLPSDANEATRRNRGPGPQTRLSGPPKNRQHRTSRIPR
jgi:hypothetical protein